MEQMQNVMLNMLQAMTSAKVESHQTTKKENSEESDFRKMMEEQQNPAQQSEKVSEKPDQKPVEKKDTESEEELDQTAMQELAAMQMFYMDAAHNLVVPEEQMVSEAAEGAAVLEEVVLVPGEEQPVQKMQDAQQAAEQLGTEITEDQPQLEKPAKAVEQDADVQMKSEEKSAETKIADHLPENVDEQKDGQNEISVTGEEVSVFEHIEAAPIKVSEVAETAQTTQTESVESQIVEKVTQAVSNGETKVELQLNPEHLGKVTIEITQKQDGTLHIAVHAENGQTRSLLERDAAGLQTLVGRNAQQEVHVEVYQPHENERGDFYDGHQHQHQEQEQQKQQRRRDEPVDFLNQLRLGLVSQDE